jgi:hypothetical protein
VRIDFAVGPPNTRPADLAIEFFCEGVFAFVTLQAKFGHTAQPARRLSSGPSGRRQSILGLPSTEV